MSVSPLCLVDDQRLANVPIGELRTRNAHPRFGEGHEDAFFMVGVIDLGMVYDRGTGHGPLQGVQQPALFVGRDRIFAVGPDNVGVLYPIVHRGRTETTPLIYPELGELTLPATLRAVVEEADVDLLPRLLVSSSPQPSQGPFPVPDAFWIDGQSEPKRLRHHVFDVATGLRELPLPFSFYVPAVCFQRASPYKAVSP